MKPDKRTRCAIYTRKSSEEGLEQSFNSLDAQREACAAYILSQAGEGWQLNKTPYDDGGFSGGNIERPALQRLLEDIAAGKVDVIVVYKVDRLTRSLSDFAKIVEQLDAKNVSFVSVTQAFNTTTSMGRLTLNVLLSFAQFEREVTGERIRDKIAASRQKGMWMGGNPPLGYDVKDRKLAINEKEKDTIQHLFSRYLELQSVPALTEELRQQGITSKRWVTATGVNRGGAPFTRGALYHLLRNRVYIGEATHKGKSYPGEHAAIIDQATWMRVQDRITANATSFEKRTAASRIESPLRDLLFDDKGNLMTPSYTSKRKGRYRYYVSQALLQHRKESVGSLARVPAASVEAAVENTLGVVLKGTLRSDFDRADHVGRWKIARRILQRVEVSDEQLRLIIKAEIAKGVIDHRACRNLQGSVASTTDGIAMDAPLKLITLGGEKKIVASNANYNTGEAPDQTLLKALARAWRWRLLLEQGAAHSLPDLAAREGLDVSYVRKILRLAFISPSKIETILRSDAASSPKLAKLQQASIPLAWH